jgi:RNA polymerase sigma-70 factor (ECF subfamily)
MKTVTGCAISCIVESAAEMTVKCPEDISGLLAAWSNGDERALRDLVSVVYPELRRIARQQLARRSPGHTLESAALANEAYLKLIRARGIHCESRAHFFALRNNRYAKRGGDAVRVPLDEVLRGTEPHGVEVLALDQALESLSKIDRRKSHVVELRFFGGLNVEETAEVLEISPETVQRDWRMAKTWLFRELTKKRE